jgi:hypothetical protein
MNERHETGEEGALRETLHTREERDRERERGERKT